MTRLSVNINKIATIRNARGGNNPDVVKVALDCERFGADGITVHPRPDERHIRRQDVYDLKKVLTTEFNIEGYPAPAFMELVCKIKPAQVTLVPDSPDQITSNHGWDTLNNQDFLTDVVSEFRNNGIRTSIFVDANPMMVELAAKAGADRVELYTEPYATNYEALDLEIESRLNYVQIDDEIKFILTSGFGESVSQMEKLQRYMAKYDKLLK